MDIGYSQIPNPFFENMYRVGLDLADSPGKSSYEEEIVGDAMQAATLLQGRTFDNIVAGEFIEHVEDPYRFLRGIKPLLADAGKLLLSTPNPLSFPPLLFELLRSHRFYYTKHHTYYFCPRWVERLLEGSGYQVVQVKGVGQWTPWGPLPCPATLSYQVIYEATPIAA